MEETGKTIPSRAAKLITGYFNFILTEKEKDELDEWICASDDNMEMFEAIVEISFLPVPPGKEKVSPANILLDEPSLILYMNKVVQEIATQEEKNTLAAHFQRKDKLFRDIFSSYE